MRIHNTHIFDTADSGNYHIAKSAADKAGMQFYSDYRANCFKCYHFEITATTCEQDRVLTLIILACTAHREQAEYRHKLAEYIAA